MDDVMRGLGLAPYRRDTSAKLVRIAAPRPHPAKPARPSVNGAKKQVALMVPCEA